MKISFPCIKFPPIIMIMQISRQVAIAQWLASWVHTQVVRVRSLAGELPTEGVTIMLLTARGRLGQPKVTQAKSPIWTKWGSGVLSRSNQMTHMDFSVINPPRVPQGHMSGITDNLALFSGFSSFFHFFEYKKNFFWPITQKIFLISSHLMIWNPDWGIF